MVRVISKSEKETIRLGEQLAKSLKPGDIVCLSGDLGSGKTTFVKGLAKGLKVKAAKVNSPTFVLLNIYQGKWPMFHFDLYRIDKIQELASMGYDEFFYDDGVAVVEWAEKLGVLIPKEYIGVKLAHRGDNQRSITVSTQGKSLRARLKGKLG